MSAESISNIIGGKKSGNGYMVRSICHNGDGSNLKLWHAPDGKLLAKCFSHGCDFRTIMEVLETEGLKEKDELSPPEKKKYAINKTRLQCQEELQIDLHVLLLIINDRLASYTLQGDDGYKKQHPEHTVMPLEPWDKELKVAMKIFKNLKIAYGKKK